MKKQIKKFTDLDAWQKAHLLAVQIYKTTRLFPKEEMFGLTAQMRRSAVSIPSNIAEGFARMSKKEKAQFMLIAKGSLNELQSQLLISRDVNLIKKEEFAKIAKDCIEVSKLLVGLLKSIK